MSTISTVIMSVVFSVSGMSEKPIINNLQFKNMPQCQSYINQEFKFIAETVGTDMVDGIWKKYPAKWILIDQSSTLLQVKSGRYNLKIRCFEVFE